MPVTKCKILLLFVGVLGPIHGQNIGGFGGGASGYDGPSILGRGGPDSGRRGQQGLPIHVQAFVNGTYDSNIMGFSVDSAGNYQPASSVGVTAGIGVSGVKSWRRTFLGIDYSGDYNHYSRRTFYNGTNHQLNLGLGRQISNKVTLATQVAAGTSNRFIGGQSVFQASEVEFISVPAAELFDSRSYFAGNTTSATYSLNSRQSFRFAGNAYTVRRKARSLVDLKAYGATGDYVHRLSKRSSFGVSYVFTHYDFEKVFGETDIHMVGAHYSRRFGRDVNFVGSVTGSQQSTVGVRSVALDPVLAALLGRGSGSEVFESNNLLYGYAASLRRQIRHSSVSVSAQRAIIPGNGFFLTSINNTASANFSYNLSRDLAYNGTLGYSKLTSLGFTAGAFKGWVAGTGVTYKLTDSFGLNAHYDWRTFDLSQTTFNRTGYRVTAGVTYFMKDGPAGLF